MKEALNYVALGKRIRNKRKTLRLTQSDLAQRTGISLSFLGHIERGSRKASLETMISIASALGVTPNDLLCDSIDVRINRFGPVPQPAEPTDVFSAIRKAIDEVELRCAKGSVR